MSKRTSYLTHQRRGDLHANHRYQVVIAGSNGYVNKSSDVVPGYSPGNYLDGKAINAPNDCNEASTYIGNQYWNDGKPFDTARCAAACELTHPMA